jgi:MFS family permease
MTATSGKAAGMTKDERFVILASSLGTVFEWYDFYLFGSLASIIGAQFFGVIDPATNQPMFNQATRDIFALLAFAAGFIVRPFGAIVFGRVGDIVGRKYTFLVTILIMGLSTFIVGILPNAATIGIAAPIILIALRLLQGLALGGEYGGAATYVAEHAPMGKRGYYTSFIQTTATLGLFLSLLVILFTRTALGEPEFAAWGWRIPFLVSVALLGVSVWIRMQMEESPAFKKMKEEGSLSKAPLTEAFGQWKNAKIALLALLGLTAGQAVVWYTGQFYALFFLQSILKVDSFTANVLIAWSLTLGTGFFIVFGALSDRIGRKPIILLGCLISAITVIPLFQLMAKTANPALYEAHQNTPVIVTTDKTECSFQFNPTGTAKFTSPCDVAKAALARASVKYSVTESAGTSATVKIGSQEPIEAKDPNFAKKLAAALTAAGYPAADNPSVVKIQIEPKDGLANFAKMFDIWTTQRLTLIGVLTILVIYVTMVYGPIAAFLVELFPTNIRYTSMSLPYHIGNGWFGGMLPLLATALAARAGNIYAGLWYPVAVALMTVVVGTLFLRDTTDRPLDD